MKEKQIERKLRLPYAVEVVMNTARQWQKFKALKRKELARKHAAGKVRTEDFTLAQANKIKRQPLDVSAVEVLEHEISLDN
jgi:hypothetical protein